MASDEDIIAKPSTKVHVDVKKACLQSQNILYNENRK